MTIEQIKARFPNASPSFIKANLDPAAVRANHPQPPQGRPLVGEPPGEDSRWHGPARLFEITFRIFSRRPCDYDGYDIKPIQDSLVAAQIIPDDRWNMLSGRIVSCKARTKKEERTEIEIVEVRQAAGRQPEKEHNAGK